MREEGALRKNKGPGKGKELERGKGAEDGDGLGAGGRNGVGVCRVEEGLSSPRARGPTRNRPLSRLETRDGAMRGVTHQIEVVLCPSTEYCRRQQQREDRGKYLYPTDSPEPQHPWSPGSAKEHCAGSLLCHFSPAVTATLAPRTKPGLESVADPCPLNN